MGPIGLLVVGSLLFCAWPIAPEASSQAPNIFKPVEGNRRWYSFESEQSLKVPGAEPLGWRVRDHVSLWDDLSLSVRDHLRDPERSHTLLAHRRRLYYVSADGQQCRLDLRQELGTRFPWRYSPNDSKYGRLVGPTAYGVAALWLNAIRFGATCDQDQARDLVCSLRLDKFDSRLELRFHQQRLLSGTLTKAHAHHVELDDTLAKRVEVNFKVTRQEVGEKLAADTRRQLERLLDLCQRSLDADRSSIFPSLMRELGESRHRAYRFMYYVKYAANGNKDETITESFSYEHRLQIVRRSHPLSIDSNTEEILFYRLLPRHGAGKTRTLTYCFREKANTCEPSEQFEQSQLAKLSPSMRRKMRFTGGPGASDREEAGTGVLWGLGPLLMNLAEVRDKVMVVETSPGLTRKQLVRWRVSEANEPLIWDLFFELNDEQSTDLPTEVDQLRKIRLYRARDDGPKLREELQMTLEVLSVSFEFELETFNEHFRLPKACPPLENQAGKEGEEEEEKEEAQVEQEEAGTAEPDDYYEFPQLEQFLNLDRGYLIESRWTLDFREHREVFRLVERQFLDAQEEQLLHRVDVFEGDHARFSLYISYSTGAVFQVQGAECRRLEQAEELPSWLRRLASVSPYLKLDSQSKPGAETALNFYGVGGLWRLAELSAKLEFLGSFAEMQEDETRFRFGQWRLENFGADQWQPGLDILYTFLLNSDLAGQNHLYSIEVSNEGGEFGEPKGITIEPIQLATTSSREKGADHRLDPLNFLLPQHCPHQLQQHYSAPKFKFPTFEDTFGQGPSLAVFELSYTLATDTGKQSVYQEITESYDAFAGLGQVRLKSSTRPAASNIWLAPGSRSVLELEPNKTCKQVAQVSDFFQLAPFIESIVDGPQRVELRKKSSNFLLANLWNLFSLRANLARPDEQLEQLPQDGSFFKPDRVGFRTSHGRQVYTLDCKLEDPKNGRSIGFVFERNLQTVKWSLKSIFLADGSRGELSIHVQSMTTAADPRKKIHLPEACSNSLYSSTFPQFNSKNLKMRSELASDLAHVPDSERRLFLLDEWQLTVKGNKRYRLQTHNLQPNEQHYLIYENSDELFDVAAEFECRTDRASDSRQVGQAAYLLGPLSLWQAASKAKEVKHVPGEPKLTNLDLLLNDEQNILDWLELSSWQVDMGDAGGTGSRFVLHFRRENELDRVEALVESAPSSRQVEMRVLWSRDGLVEAGDLVIPKWHGCRPVGSTHLGPILDLLSFNMKMPMQFHYEASLVQNGKPSSVRHSGSYARCSDHWDTALLGPFQVNVQRSHRLDGSATSTRHIISKEVRGEESTSLQHRLLNEITGECSIWAQSNSSGQVLSLEFDHSKGLEMVVTERVMRLLLTETSDFHLVNKLEDENGYVQVVYEAQVPKVEVSQEIYGPALVTRTFLRSPLEEAASRRGHITTHRSATIEVLWPRLHTRLVLNIRNLDFEGGLNVVFEHARPEDCRRSTDFSRPAAVSRRPSLRTFVITFKPASDKADKSKLDMKTFLSLESQLKNRFAKQLIRFTNYQLVPMQLGRLNMVFDELRGHLEAEFGLIEPPSPIEYFSKRASVSLSLETKAKIRLVSSPGACSVWCAEWACIALVYCPSTRSCQIVLGVVGSANSTTTNNKSLIEGLRLTVDEDCNLYHAPAGQLHQPLDKLIPLLEDHMTNLRGPNKSFEPWRCSNFLSLDLQASELREITGNYELDSRQSAPELFGHSPGHEYRDSYALVRSSSRLHPLSSGGINQRWLSVVESRKGSRAECLMSCGLSDCQLVTYCANDNYCLVVGNLTDYSTYHQLLDESAVTTKACSTFSEDFLLNYQHFPETRPPTESVRITANQSLLECAASCDLQLASGCMSFDYCTSSTAGSTSCHLQENHVIMDDFDAAILSLNSSDKSLAEGENKLLCSHYSKSLLADFELHQDQQFKEHNTVVFKNTDLDRCALICRRDDTCLAFEHCHSRISLETMETSCFLRRNRVEDVSVPEEEDKLDLEAELVKAHGCTVYQVKHNRERFEFKRARDGDRQPVIELTVDDTKMTLGLLINHVPPHVVSLASLVGSILVALFVGCIFHLGFIRVTGDIMPMFR